MFEPLFKMKCCQIKVMMIRQNSSSRIYQICGKRLFCFGLVTTCASISQKKNVHRHTSPLLIRPVIRKKTTTLTPLICAPMRTPKRATFAQIFLAGVSAILRQAARPLETKTKQPFSEDPEKSELRWIRVMREPSEESTGKPESR